MDGSSKDDEKYKYTKLNDLTAGKIYNVYGVVKYFKKPFISISGEYAATISLIDPSLTDLEQSLKCVLFSKEFSELPKFRYIGEIVRFHRIKVGNYNGRLQAQKGPGFSWIVVHEGSGGNTNGGFNLDHSHPHYTFTDKDKENIRELQQWAGSLSLIKEAKAVTLFQDTNPDENFINVICQVISIHPGVEDQHYTVIRAWDGSKILYRSFMYNKIEAAKHQPPDSLASKTTRRAVDIFCYDDHVKDCNKLKPGDFVHLTNVHQKFVNQNMLEKAVENDFVSMNEVTAQPWIGFIIHKGTMYGRGIRLLESTEPEAQTVQSRIDSVAEEQRRVEEAAAKELENIDEDWPFCEDEMSQVNSLLAEDCRNDAGVTANDRTSDIRPLQESNSSASHNDISFTSISKILNHPIVPYKFRCRARVLYYEPKSAEDIMIVACEKCDQRSALANISEEFRRADLELRCSSCSAEFSMQFLFHMLLEDNTGILRVTVCDDDATEFFAGFSFDDVICKDEVRRELEAKLSDLIGGDNSEGMLLDLGDDVSHRPYIECCIKSFNAVCPDDETKNKICYRIFDTKLY
eukprot:gene8435-9335_t